MRLSVRVHPRASRARLRWDGAVVEVWVTPPAAGDEANRALLRMLAGWLDMPPSSLRIVAGARSRTKVVEVDGVEAPPPSP